MSTEKTNGANRYALLVPLVVPAILVIGLVVSLTNPKVTKMWGQAHELAVLDHAKKIQAAMQQMARDGVARGNQELGWPQDAGVTSVRELRQKLLREGYSDERKLEFLEFRNLLIGNVSASDPGDTILIRYGNIVVDKDGTGAILKEGESPTGREPPRAPAYLPP